jgi:hypothetical protein
MVECHHKKHGLAIYFSPILAREGEQLFFFQSGYYLILCLPE